MTVNRRVRWIAVMSAVVSLTPALLAAPAEAKKRKPDCKRGYQVTEYKGERLQPTWSTRHRNTGGRSDTVELTVTESGTVQTKTSANVEAEVGGSWVVFSASIKAQLGFEITKSKTTQRDLKYTVDVPPHSELRVQYGVWTRKVRGAIFGKPLDPNTPTVTPFRNCNREFRGYFNANVATTEVGFDKHVRRLDG
jgi:hypothetical protein